MVILLFKIGSTKGISILTEESKNFFNNESNACDLCNQTGQIIVKFNAHKILDLIAEMSEICPICCGKGYIGQ